MDTTEKYIIAGIVISVLVIGYLVARKMGKLPGNLDVFGQKDRQLDNETPQLQGDDVKELQEILTEVYAKGGIEAGPGVADGIYGPLTKISHDSLIRNYQLSDRTLKAAQKVVA